MELDNWFGEEPLINVIYSHPMVRDGTRHFYYSMCVGDIAVPSPSQDCVDFFSYVGTVQEAVSKWRQ